MGFFMNMINGFKAAAKAGKEFNPELEDVIKKLETLHSEGKLNDTIYQAEQEYVKHHAEYTADKHPSVAASKEEVGAITHFMDALAKNADTLDPSVKDEAKHLVELKDQMMNIIGDIKGVKDITG